MPVGRRRHSPGALGLALGGPRRYGAVEVDGAWLNPGGRARRRRRRTSRAAIRLIDAAWALLVVLASRLRAITALASRDSEDSVEVEMRGEMRGEAVERRLDARLVASRRPRAELLQESAAKPVAGEEAVHVGAGDEAVRRDGAVRPAADLEERPRAVRPLAAGRDGSRSQ